MKRVLMIIGSAALLAVMQPQTKAVGGGNPDPGELVPKTVAAGIGQLLTIQGFNLFEPGATRVTLTPTAGGPANKCILVLPDLSSPNELYVRLGVRDGDPIPSGCSGPIPSQVPPGKYKVTVTTSKGTSPPIGLQVNDKPQTPIPRRLMACPSTSEPCTPASFFKPGDRLGILAYGTDITGAKALFMQQGAVVEVSSDLTYVGGGQPDPSNRGLINTFLVPTVLSPGPALVQLRTTVKAIGGGSPDPGESPLSHALVFTVVLTTPGID